MQLKQMKTIAIFSCIFLFACSSVDNRQKTDLLLGNNFPTNKSRLFVYRLNSSYGAGVIYNLKVDENSIGVLTIGQYKEIILEPGIHEFKAFREIEVNVTKEFKPGENYFLEEGRAFGVRDGRPKLEFVSRDRALKKIAECNNVDLSKGVIKAEKAEKANSALAKMKPQQRDFVVKVLMKFNKETKIDDITSVLGTSFSGTSNNPEWLVGHDGVSLQIVKATFISNKLFSIQYRQIPFFVWENTFE